jgi:predicted O-methyltransferase YrrM
MRTRIIRLLDRLAPLLYQLIGRILRVHAFLGAREMPRAHQALDKFDIACVPYHYYQPVYNVADLPERTWIEEDPLTGLNMNLAGQVALLEEFHFNEELQQFPYTEKPGDALGFYYSNSAYVEGDAEILYSMIRHFQPRTLIEIGSGFSTRLAKNALDKNRAEGHPSKHICIEPYEKPWLEQLGVDEVIRRRVEDISPATFAVLEANDILFIDSSHVLRTGGDVFHEYLRILPALNSGVIIHIHDIFFPFEYPRHWIQEQRWLWTEQYLLQAFLVYNSEFEVLLALSYLAHVQRQALAEKAPLFAQHKEAQPGAFWMRKK